MVTIQITAKKGTPKMPRSEFGWRLAKLLKTKRITQASVAKSLGIQRASVSDWIHGRSRPSAGNLSRLASLTGETEASLLGVHPGRENASQRRVERLEKHLGAARLDLLADVPAEEIDRLLAGRLLKKVLES